MTIAESLGYIFVCSEFVMFLFLHLAMWKCSESILVSFCRNLRPRFMLRGGMLSNIYVLVMGLFTIALT
jgi:hypothetical protein